MNRTRYFFHGWGFLENPGDQSLHPATPWPSTLVIDQHAQNWVDILGTESYQSAASVRPVARSGIKHEWLSDRTGASSHGGRLIARAKVLIPFCVGWCWIIGPLMAYLDMPVSGRRDANGDNLYHWSRCIGVPGTDSQLRFSNGSIMLRTYFI